MMLYWLLLAEVYHFDLLNIVIHAILLHHLGRVLVPLEFDFYRLCRGFTEDNHLFLNLLRNFFLFAH